VFDLNIEKIVVLAVIALIVLGPERLPGFAASAARLLRNLRRMAQDATADIREELGPEFRDLDIAELHPRRLIQKHLLDDPDDQAVPEPAAVAVAADPPPFDVEAT
jgi:sec-independent protein translocase protein TatB